MSDIVKRLQAAIRYDTFNGTSEERAIAVNQVREAAKAIAALQQQLAAAEARVRELEAVVAMLPKDADGDPLIPNQPYWFISNREMRFGYYTIASDAWYPEVGHVTDCFVPSAMKSYYKTQEAAEAAKGGG